MKWQEWLALYCIRDMLNLTVHINLNGTTGDCYFVCVIPFQFSQPTNILQCLIMVALLSRGISTFHALFVAVASVYILIVSDLFKEGSKNDLITYRRSILSDTALGVRSWILLCNLWLFRYWIRLMLIHLNVLIYQMNNVFFWWVNYKLKPYALQTLHKQKILSIQRKDNI